MKPLRCYGTGILAGVFLVFGVAVARADETLAGIGERIAQYPVIRAEFEQTKQMAALKRPLVTSGHLTFSRQYGVLWVIEKPYRMSYVLSETRVAEIGSDGVRRIREAKDVAGLAQVGRVFRALLGANTEMLRDYFETTVESNPAQWRINLKPKQPQLAQYIAGMQVSGGRFVEAIRIDERRGDTARIVFNRVEDAAVPNEAELALFGADTGARVSP